jgi:hypothetical protein
VISELPVMTTGVVGGMSGRDLYEVHLRVDLASRTRDPGVLSLGPLYGPFRIEWGIEIIFVCPDYRWGW